MILTRVSIRLASSQSPTEETTAMKREPLTTSTGTLTSLSPVLSFSSEPSGNSFNAPQLPTLPLDLVAEILCRLPVKFLLQLRCVCKSWNSLISDDTEFAKKHLHVSTTRHRHHLILSSANSSREVRLWYSSITSVFSSVSSSTTTTVEHTQLECPLTPNNGYGDVFGPSACDGILCYAADQYRAVLWNPSIGKFKILPPLENPRRRITCTSYSFGYHHFTNNYKVVAVSYCNKTQVRVHTLGTDSWTSIPDFPDYGLIRGPGIFVSDTVNWLALEACSCSQIIISLDLEKESYQKLLQPEYGRVTDTIMTLGVLRDCLCILTRGDTYYTYSSIWLMKEYGNEESWTKLFSVPYMDDHGFLYYTKAVYIYEDDQVLLEFLKLGKLKLVVYDSRNDTFKIPEIQDTKGWMAPEVCVDSLISPFSYC